MDSLGRYSNDLPFVFNGGIAIPPKTNVAISVVTMYYGCLDEFSLSYCNGCVGHKVRSSQCNIPKKVHEFEVLNKRFQFGY